ncbi:Tox-REase-5 domain-containing protein [Caballeronia sp. LZ016]|uniref:Tox-REase-5 domain-containing protein n=1 Tax=Caballeronia sp. LZ016 TaxID=3038554 RepID=UPI002858B644|nr:Tox-REase-5 domain-containing protein [Caballeronia sp. LZ016]MDR5738073.1 Tox-REase-5 domain-containing protein [Caballeronia sp. LZ016]
MTEWSFAGADFDGFRSSLCQLEEAKARYDQFFDKMGEPKRFFRLFGVTKMLGQGANQNAIVVANAPAKLRWYFMQPVSHRYFTRAFRTSAPLIVTELKPMQ